MLLWLFGSNSAGNAYLEKQLRVRGLTVWTIKNGYSACSNVSLNLLLKNDITLWTSKILLSLFKGQLPALENISQHTLIAALKANIRMGEQGLGLIIIQNGPYLQITSLVEKSSAANNGKLKPGKKEPTVIFKFNSTENILVLQLCFEPVSDLFTLTQIKRNSI